MLYNFGLAFVFLSITEQRMKNGAPTLSLTTITIMTLGIILEFDLLEGVT